MRGSSNIFWQWSHISETVITVCIELRIGRFFEAERTTQDGGPLNTGKVGVSLYPIWLLYKACISRTSQITARRIDLSAQNSKFCGEKYTQLLASVHWNVFFCADNFWSDDPNISLSFLWNCMYISVSYLWTTMRNSILIQTPKTVIRSLGWFLINSCLC